MIISIPISSTRKGIPCLKARRRRASFIERDYGAYVGDSYRATRELTLNFGVRYENFRPLYEANGTQVAPTVPLNDYFATRNYLSRQGVPQNAMPQRDSELGSEWTGQRQADMVEAEQFEFRAARRAGISVRRTAAEFSERFSEDPARSAPAPAWCMTASAATWSRNTISTARSAWPPQRTSRTPIASPPVRALTALRAGSAGESAAAFPIHAAADRRDCRRFPGHLARPEAALFLRAQREFRARDSRRSDD